MLPSEKWILSAEQSAKGGQVAYQDWFDRTTSLECTRSQACVDLFGKIMTPDVLARIGNPYDQCVLEIGSGGGRLLGCAAQCFGRAIGVDIVYRREPLAAMSRDFLTSWGVEDRCELMPPEGLTSVAPGSVGFVYSYIVFQHMDSLDVVREYLTQVRRVLRSGGTARIFFGLSEMTSHTVPTDEFVPDRLFFSSTLKVTLRDFLASAEAAGLRTVGHQPVVRKQPWSVDRSSQAMCDLTV
jgi:hypothetical protein